MIRVEVNQNVYEEWPNANDWVLKEGCLTVYDIHGGTCMKTYNSGMWLTVDRGRVPESG